MGKGNFTEDFKLDAIKQITERGYPVLEVSQRLGVSTHSLYGWIKRYAASPGAAVKDDQPAEIWTHPGKVEAPYTVCIASASNLTGLVKSSVECRRTGL